MEITRDPPSILDMVAAVLTPVFLYVLFNGDLRRTRPQQNFRNTTKTCLHLVILLGVPLLLMGLNLSSSSLFSACHSKPIAVCNAASDSAWLDLDLDCSMVRVPILQCH